MKTILITGGTGFIGQHLIQAMKTKGYSIIAMVRSSSKTNSIDNFVDEYIYAELSEIDGIHSAIEGIHSKGVKLNYVIHAAALTKANAWNEFEEVNIKATEKLAQSIQTFYPDLEKFVFISSLAAAGPQKIGNIITLSQENPITQYGKSKLVAEKRLKETGVKWFNIRPTAVYGPGEKDLFILFKNVYSGISPIIGNHKQELTFIHVNDLVDVIVNSVEIPEIHKTIYVTDGNIYSKQELSGLVEKRLKRKPLRVTIPLWIVKGLAVVSEGINKLKSKPGVLSLEKFGELKAESWNCDMEPINKLMQFQPLYDLHNGLNKTLDWYENEGWLKKTNK